MLVQALELTQTCYLVEGTVSRVPTATLFLKRLEEMVEEEEEGRERPKE